MACKAFYLHPLFDGNMLLPASANSAIVGLFSETPDLHVLERGSSDAMLHWFFKNTRRVFLKNQWDMMAQ